MLNFWMTQWQIDHLNSNCGPRPDTNRLRYRLPQPGYTLGWQWQRYNQVICRPIYPKGTEKTNKCIHLDFNTFYLVVDRLKHNTCSPFYKHGLTLIPAWIINYIHNKVWNEITYPFLNFNRCTAEVYEWISNFIPHLTGHVIIYPSWD